MKSLLLFYFIILNCVTFFMMWSDKSRAIKNRWRIPEKTLFLFSFLGGALGTFLGMYIFRHKTRHLSFRILIPLFILLHLVLCYILFIG